MLLSWKTALLQLLEDYGDYGDCIETGFDYKAPNLFRLVFQTMLFNLLTNLHLQTLMFCILLLVKWY
jgi:hypothetical protein